MRKKNISLFIIIIFIAVGLMFFNNQAIAVYKNSIVDFMNKAGNSGWGTDAPTAESLPDIIGVIVEIFLGFLGIIFLILIIYAGYQWMTAQGDEEKVTKAKNTLSMAVIGLIIIILAYAITFFVFSNLPTQ